MTEEQARTARAIVNIFETGRVAGDYGAVTLIRGDPGHLTYGRSQTTLASGNLFLLIKAYCEQPTAMHRAVLEPFLPRLSARDVSLDVDSTFRDLLADAGDDPVMIAEQDRFFDDHYFKPACRVARQRNITTALGQTVVYDSTVHGGFGKVAALVGARAGEGGLEEREWVKRYVAAREAWLRALKPPLPKTVYRMNVFSDLIAKNAWDLPLSLTVRGVTITPQNLDPTPVLRASAVDPADPPPARILHLTNPYMRGEDVRVVQEALNANGLANGRDGVYGPFTAALVRSFQQSKQMRADGVVGPATRQALGL